MIEKSVVQKEFFDFVSDHDTSWASLNKLEPLAVCQIYYILQEMMHMMKLSAAESQPIDVSGESEFLLAVKEKDSAVVWPILDDLMDTIRVTAPRAYSNVMRKIKSI